MMTRRKPECDAEMRYCVREAAELLGVDRHTVRRWEKAGCIRFDTLAAGGTKFTTGKQILRCWERTYLPQRR